MTDTTNTPDQIIASEGFVNRLEKKRAAANDQIALLAQHASAASAAADFEKADTLMNECQFANGYRNAVYTIHRMVAAGGVTAFDVMTALMSLVLAGPNDTWSGRGNDGRRAGFDGVIKAAAEINGMLS